tara:strand:- start:3201 stop:4676 length:1476 start_codon:yes stop_codon:yes gene_type:complete
MKAWEENLDLLIRARTPIILIRTNEEIRVEELLQKSSSRFDSRRLAIWDYIQGLQGLINSNGVGAKQPMAVLQWLQKVESNNPTTLFLKDFHQFCEDPGIARMLKNLSLELRKTSHNIILSSGTWNPPSDLDDVLSILDLPLPTQSELKGLLKNIANASGSSLDENVLEELTRACSGLSEIRVRQVAARALAQRGKMGREDLKEVLEEKRQNIARSEVLEYCETKNSQADVGGLDALKKWLGQRYVAFSKEAKDFGLPLPKGVLLLGPQGTGKSLTAKSIADSWSMPLLRLDVGRLFAGLVGASEARTRETIQRAEAMSPCILWIDEIDKAFGGDSRSDGGTSQRVLANILTWMAEKTSAVFVVATANAIDRLPPELLRKGRFDEIFMLELPVKEERLSILNLHVQQRRPNLNIHLETIVDRTGGFSGAELEQVVIEGMHIAFAEKRELQESDLIIAAAQLVPLSRTAKEQLESLKEWASTGRARPASIHK